MYQTRTASAACRAEEGGRERETEVERRWSWCGMRMAGLRLCTSTFPCVCPCMCRAGSGRSGRSCEPFFFRAGEEGGAIAHRPMPFCLMQAGNTRPGLVLGWQFGAAPEQAATWGLLLFMRGVAPSRRHLYSYRSRSYLRYASHAVQYMYSEGHRIDVATGPQAHSPQLRCASGPILPCYRMIQYKRGIFICKSKASPFPCEFCVRGKSMPRLRSLEWGWDRWVMHYR